MRYSGTVVLVATALFFFAVPPSNAEALNGEQIKKLLIGNTVFREHESRKGRSRKTWIYFKNETAMSFKQKREVKRRRYKTTEFEGTWSVTAAGKLCWDGLQRSIQNKICGNIVRVVGDAVRLDGLGDMKKRKWIDMKKRKWKLFKGNPEGL